MGHIRGLLALVLVLALGVVPPPADATTPFRAAPGVSTANAEDRSACAVRGDAVTCIESAGVGHGEAMTLPSMATLEAGAGKPAAPGLSGARTPGIACAGNGRDGNRVQAVYAYTGVNRFAQVAPLIRRYAAQVDAVFRTSAVALGGPARRVRWVTSATCVLSVVAVKASRPVVTHLERLAGMLRGLNLDRADRLYLVWVDFPAARWCGVGEQDSDAAPGPANRSNRGPRYAEVFSTCWGESEHSGNDGYESSEAHELMHMLGGVNRAAPHATRSGHCRDEWDLMCYRLHGDKPMLHVCPAAWRNRFDCNGDAYFDPSPRAGSWLARHWNTADSSFLVGSDRAAPVVTHVTAEQSRRVLYSNVTWSIREDQAVNAVVVEQRVDGRPWRVVSRNEMGYFGGPVRRGCTYQWRVRVMDSAGRWAAWATSARLAIPPGPGAVPT